MARKAVIHDNYRLVGTYERLRKAVLDLPRDGRLEKQLSYWVLPSDRRLPIAFLDFSLQELLSQPLDELMKTPGVGQKKILGFFDLLRRISKASTPGEPFGMATPRSGTTSVGVSSAGFDASTVSEALWSTWCETIVHHGMGDQKLGRLAPSLQSLPTVIWHAPLSVYAELPLAKIRRMRTHGEKRVHAILEVFGAVHEAISTSALHENLDLELSPRFVPKLTRWLTEVVWEDFLPAADCLQERVVAPMVRQVEVDLGRHVAQLASDRLLPSSGAASVKQQSEALGVTRARVYQLLEDCAKAMDVRWPEGRWLLAPLASKFDDAEPQAIGLVHGVIDLFFPVERPSRGDAPNARNQRSTSR